MGTQASSASSSAPDPANATRIPSESKSGPSVTDRWAGILGSTSRLPRPDHRWRLAEKLVHGEKISHPEDMVAEAVKVLPGGTRLTKNEREKITEAVREAIRIHEAEDTRTKDTLEAWLLCELEIPEIAAKAALKDDVVQVYRDLFFNVSPWLKSEPDREDLAWLLIGELLYTGIPETDFGTWKRYTAISGGPFVLAGYLDYLHELPIVVPRDVTRISDERLKRLRDLTNVRIYMLSKAPITSQAQARRHEFVMTLKESQRLKPITERGDPWAGK